jgi:hypothetical protein
MDIEAFSKYYVDSISLAEGDNNAPLPHVFKQMATLKIPADESDYKTRSVITFNNKNLDIVTDPHNSYLYIQYGFTMYDNVGSSNLAMSDTGTNGAAQKSDTCYWRPVGIPCTAAHISGYDYKWNDTTIDNQNNSLAASLYAINYGKYDASSVQHEHLGLIETMPPTKTTTQGDKTGNTQEWIVRLSDFIPYLRDNKQVVSGIKQTLVITKETVINTMFELIGTHAAASSMISLTVNKFEWHLPYVKLENQKQLELWNNMYNSTYERYWLSNDQFISSPYSNEDPHSNDVWRISTKGLNSRPRWLVLHAITGTATSATNNIYKPLGFDATGTNDSIRVKKLRIKINGIYVDQGDVWEGTVQNAATGSPYLNCENYMTKYEDYVKFFNKLHNSKEVAPLSYYDWLAKQIYVFDLVNGLDSEQIFANSGNALIIELEFSTEIGNTTNNSTFKWCANLLHDKRIKINNYENKAIIEQY